MSIKDVSPEFIDYCVLLDDNECFCPERYINHSDKPNVTRASKAYQLVTLRKINAGEEILINFNKYNEPEHLKKSYYKTS